MKTRLLAFLMGVVLAALPPAGCDRPAPSPARVVAARAPVASSRPAVLAPAPEAGPHPGEEVWVRWFKTVAEVSRPCDEVMTALSRAPRAHNPAAIRQLAQSGESDCFTASGGYGAVAPPAPLPPAGRRDLDRGISALSKAYLGRSLGLNELARPASGELATDAEDPEAAQILGHAQDDIVAARARLIAVARRYGYSRVDGPEVVATATAPQVATAPEHAETTGRGSRRRLTAWRARSPAQASEHRWRAQDRRWAPPPYPRYAAAAAPCDLGEPLSARNCAHAYRNSEDAYTAQDRQEDARPRHGCRRFWVLPCRLFGRGR